MPQSDVVGGVSTGNIADLEISFSKQQLHSLDNMAFTTFFAAITDTQGLEFELKGFADVVARTTIGDVPISNIPFNVLSAMKGKFRNLFHIYIHVYGLWTTTCAGINSFGHTADLENVIITGSSGSGRDQYINADLTTMLQNPSNISLQTNGVSLAVFYEDVKIGRAVIDVCSFTPAKARGVLILTYRH